MKRKELVDKLVQDGWVLKRNGGSHDIYQKGSKREAIPRHREINEELAKAILRRCGL